MRRPIGALVLLAAAPAFAGAPPAPRPAEARILSRLDRVAGLYRDTALKFECEEQIIYAATGRTSRFLNFQYIYEYSDEGGLLDFRLDRRTPWKAGKPNKRARLSEYGLPYYLMRGYSWIFLLDRAHQPKHAYTIGAETTAMGRPALPIAFEPAGTVEADINDWFGTIWVDAETMQPLRVEAMKAPEHEKERALREALSSTGPIKGKAREGWIIGRVATEFTHVKNAMRFPGKVVVTGTHDTIRIRRGRRAAEVKPLFTVTQLYNNYRFFGVRAEEAVLRTGRGD